MYKYLLGRNKEDRIRLSGVSDRIRGNRHKQKHRGFYIDIEKTFYIVRVVKHRNRLPARLWSLQLWRYSKSGHDPKQHALTDPV